MVKIVNGEIVPDGSSPTGTTTNNDSILPTNIAESSENMSDYFGSPIRLCGKSISRGMLYGVMFFILIFFSFKMFFLVAIGLGVAYYMENRDSSNSTVSIYCIEYIVYSLWYIYIDAPLDAYT